MGKKSVEDIANKIITIPGLLMFGFILTYLYLYFFVKDSPNLELVGNIMLGLLGSVNIFFGIMMFLGVYSMSIGELIASAAGGIVGGTIYSSKHKGPQKVNPTLNKIVGVFLTLMGLLFIYALIT